MGFFTVKTTLEEVQNAIIGFIDGRNWIWSVSDFGVNCLPNSQERLMSIEAQDKCPWHCFSIFQWNIKYDKNQCLIDFEIKQRRYVSYILSVLLILTLCSFIIFIDSLSRSLRLSFIFSWLMVLLVLPLGTIYIYIKKKAAKIERDLWDILSQQLKGGSLKSVYGMGWTSFVDSHFMFFSIPFGIISLIFFYKIGMIYFLIYIAIKFFQSYPTHLLEMYYRRNPFVQWKVDLIETVGGWVELSNSILFFVLILYYMNAAIFGFANTPYSFVSDPPINGLNNLFGLDSTTQALSRSSENLLEANMNLVNEKFSRVLRTMIMILLGTPIILSSLSLFHRYYLFFITADSWKEKIGSQDPTYISILPIHSETVLQNYITKIVLMLYCLASAILNMCAIVIGIDAAYFILFEKTILVKSLSIVFTWVPTLFFLLIGTGVPFVAAILSDVIMMSLVLPFLLLMTSITVKGIWSLINGKRVGYRPNKESPSLSLIYFIENVANKYHLDQPKLIFTDNQEVEIVTRIGWPWSRKKIIEISQGAMESLSEKELIAGVAHEIGHIAQGLGPLRVARLLSRIAMFPNNILSLYFDFAQMEFQADKFALEAGVDKEVLSLLIARSVVKTKRQTTASSPFLNRNQPLIQKIMIVTTFFLSEELLRYGHPYWQERLERIQSYAS